MRRLFGQCHILNSDQLHFGETTFQVTSDSTNRKCLETYAGTRKKVPYPRLCETTLRSNHLSTKLLFHHVRRVSNTLLGKMRKGTCARFCETILWRHHVSTHIWCLLS